MLVLIFATCGVVSSGDANAPLTHIMAPNCADSVFPFTTCATAPLAHMPASATCVPNLCVVAVGSLKSLFFLLVVYDRWYASKRVSW